MMDDGMLSAVPVAHLEVRAGSADAGRCDVVGTVCRRRCCGGHSDDDRRRGCSSVVCGSVCTRTMLVVINLTFFVSTSHQTCAFLRFLTQTKLMPLIHLRVSDV